MVQKKPEPEVITGPLTRSFVRPFAQTTHSLACSAPLHSFALSLAPSLPSSWESDSLDAGTSGYSEL